MLNAILDSNRWKETMNMFKDVFNDDLEMDDVSTILSTFYA